MVESGKIRRVVHTLRAFESAAMPANPFLPPVAHVADVALPADEAEIEFDLRYRDLLLFNWLHQLTSPGMHLMFAGLAMMFFWTDIGRVEVAGWLGPMLFAFVVFWALQLGAVALLLVTRRNRTLLTRHVVRLGPDALRQRSRYVETTWFWPGVRRVVKRPGFVAVYQSQTGAQIVPNRAFGGRVQRDEFLRYARERVAAAA